MSESKTMHSAGDMYQHGATLNELVISGERQLIEAGVSFGHGTTNARDEASWLVLWCLGLPLDTHLDPAVTDQLNDGLATLVSPSDCLRVATLFGKRIETRKPAAYLTQEAWLQGVSFFVDERVIVPRSFIAELLVNGGFDYWLSDSTQRVLDLCTGNGSLAVISAMVFPDVLVVGSDLSRDALCVAQINIDKHALQHRIQLVESDGLSATALAEAGPYDLILCNPPYVNADSMETLPPEYQAEPFMALDGNQAGSRDGMDFVRALLKQAPKHLTSRGVLVLEIGNERVNFEAAFPQLEVVWLETSAGDDQVLLITLESLLK